MVTGQERYHAFDNLRTAMMLLGVALHTFVSYVKLPLEETWPYKDVSTSGLFDLLVLYIHVFRMPVFFLMAGFFAALLRQRRGVAGLLRNRVARIAVPLVVFWIVLQPVVRAGFAFARSMKETGLFAEAWKQALSIAPYTAPRPMHLWFLYDLLYFYAFAAVMVACASRWPGLRRALDAGFRALMRKRARLWILAGLSWLTLLPMRSGALDTASTFVPVPRVLGAYALFFAFGWMLFRHRDLLSTLATAAWRPLLLGTLLLPVHLVGVTRVSQAQPGRDWPMHLLATASAALVVWLLVFGLLALFLRRLDQPRRTWRYLSDGSYWIYLIHLPLVITASGLLAPLRWPAPLKALVVLLLVVPVLLASYHLLVRPTALGRWLGGGRRSGVASAARRSS